MVALPVSCQLAQGYGIAHFLAIFSGSSELMLKAFKGDAQTKLLYISKNWRTRNYCTYEHRIRVCWTSGVVSVNFDAL